MSQPLFTRALTRRETGELRQRIRSNCDARIVRRAVIDHHRSELDKLFSSRVHDDVIVIEPQRLQRV